MPTGSLNKFSHMLLDNARLFVKRAKRWEDEPTRQQKLRAWEEIRKTLEDGHVIANWMGFEDCMLYKEAQHELEEAIARMREFHLFLPYELFEARVWFVCPRVKDNGVIQTGKARETIMADRQVAEAHWRTMGPAVEHPWRSDSDDDSLATESS